MSKDFDELSDINNTINNNKLEKEIDINTSKISIPEDNNHINNRENNFNDTDLNVINNLNNKEKDNTNYITTNSGSINNKNNLKPIVIPNNNIKNKSIITFDNADEEKYYNSLTKNEQQLYSNLKAKNVKLIKEIEVA